MRLDLSFIRRGSTVRNICLATVGLALIGCGTFSPFLAARFNNNLPGVPSTGGGNNNGNDNADDDGVFEFLDEIPFELRTFQTAVFNSAPYPVRHRALFVVTAGEGGFVREEEAILDYISAGYRDLITPGSEVGSTVRVGCVQLRLTRGTRLLGMTAGDFLGQEVFIPPNLTGDPNMTAGPAVSVRNDNRDPNLPLPEFIVHTTENPGFICADPLRPCTQEGFQYFDISQTQQIGKAVTGSRIQGTVCNFGIGQSPEHRLDRTDDGQILPFQFVPGGTVLFRVLDRAFDADTNNRVQVVWAVLDANGNVVIPEAP